MNADGTGKRVLTEKFDRSPGALMWAQNSATVYFNAEDRGMNNLYSVALNSSDAPKQITEGVHQLFTGSMSRNNFVVGTMTTSQTPSDVIVFDPSRINRSKQRITFQSGQNKIGGAFSPNNFVRLSNVNDDILEGRKLGEVEEIWYDSVGGMKVQGWLVKPPDFNPAKKYPLMLYIHGGPHAMYGTGMNFEFQSHAAAGYVVLYTNPRGSTGYGQAFGNAINNAYPGDDYHDLMRGVDKAVKRGYIDERNLFVCGGSGGGVLTTWIVGHTDRFRAAVAMKPVVNWYSFVGTTDGSSWYYNFKKLPWEDPAEHLQRSPLTYVGNVKTPTMLLTGDLDLRTPMEQTEQYYRALKLRKIPTMMVRIADEYHGINADFGLRHPSNRLYQMLYLRGWFDKYRQQ
jgi:dipeptidyl aminopeptidase/acylaminoacyl peptidase